MRINRKNIYEQYDVYILQGIEEYILELILVYKDEKQNIDLFLEKYIKIKK